MANPNLYRIYRSDNGKLVGYVTSFYPHRAMENFRKFTKYKGDLTCVTDTLNHTDDVFEVIERNMPEISS